MMEAKRRYYLAQGDDEAIVRDFFERRKAAFEQAREIAERHGGKPVTQGRSFVGVAFDDGAPEGWRRVGGTGDGEPYYIPVRRSKAGKEAFDELRSVRIPGAEDLHSKFSSDGGCFGEAGPRGGFWMLYITAEIVNDQCIIHVPEQMDFEPPHSKPLKQSEYWQIKETAEAA